VRHVLKSVLAALSQSFWLHKLALTLCTSLEDGHDKRLKLTRLCVVELAVLSLAMADSSDAAQKLAEDAPVVDQTAPDAYAESWSAFHEPGI
jgi:hypothetical protein